MLKEAISLFKSFCKIDIYMDCLLIGLGMQVSITIKK